MPTRRPTACLLALCLSLLSPEPAVASPSPPVHQDIFNFIFSLKKGDRDLGELARLAVGFDKALARAAQARIRAAGPAGLRAFEATHGVALDAARAAITDAADASWDRRDPAQLDDPARADLLAALDAVCGQRDCVLSRLYWHTELEAAVRAASREGKPILSLRLLGDLRDELSCANSRFFRALLYPDPAVHSFLRAHFVLHWASERPAPKLTIDLGDGHSVTTTITGNSAHFVLDPHGRPVDVIPGLYAPADFLAALARAEPLARATASLTGDARRDALARHHEVRLADLDRLRPDRQPPPPTNLAPRAGQAAPIAITKMAAEAPILGRLGEPIAPDPIAASLERRAADAALTIQLSRPSLGLIRTQQWRSGEPTRDVVAAQLAHRALRLTLARDTLRNEHEIHRQIHTWWATGAAAPLDLPALARRVYDELFLTPRSDPWLGLADPATYGALVAGGRSATPHL